MSHRVRILISILFAVTTVVSPSTKAETVELVEIRTKDDVYLPYRERRGTHGMLFAVNFENYLPKKYESTIDGETFGSMFGSTNVQLMGFEAGYKFNFSMGSLAALFGLSSGKTDGSGLGETRTFNIDITRLKALLILDTLMPEPWAAPYGGIGIWKFGVDEKIPDAGLKFSGQSQQGFFTTVGILFQMNWLEGQAARDAYLTSGLENTYLDFFMNKYEKTSGQSDPNGASDFNWGAGMRMEF